MKKTALFALSIAIISVFSLGVVFGPAPVLAQGVEAGEQEQIRELQATVVQLLKLIVELQRQLLAARQAQTLGTPLCGQAEITWGSVPGATEYVLYRTGIEVYQGRELRFLDKGLAPGTTYAYTVRARNAGGLGPSSPVQTITTAPQCAPAAPFVRAQEGAVCGGTTQIFWSQARGATFYELFRGAMRIFSGTAISFMDRNLVSGSSYAYRVRAGNSGGLGSFSSETIAKASVVCPPAAPKAPVVSDPIAGSIAREGIFTVAIQSSPSGVTVQSEQAGANVLSFGVFAKLSPIFVNRVDADFSERPWLFLSVVELREGSWALSKVEVFEDSFVKMDNGKYRLSFVNFSVEVPEGGGKTVSVFVVAKDGLLLASPRELTVSIPANSVRGKDEAGVTQAGPGAQEAAAFVKTFFVERKK